MPQSIVFSRNVVEFVTVGVQFSSFLEEYQNGTILDFSTKLTKILPFLYMKATMLPAVEVEYDVYPEIVVSEIEYDAIVARLFSIFLSNDTYLEVFMDDMKFSDTPISASISEDLADIYQDIKNFVSVYENGLEESMMEALFVCQDNFKLYWGQKLVNVLRALHCLAYSPDMSNLDNDYVSENLDSEW